MGWAPWERDREGYEEIDMGRLWTGSRPPTYDEWVEEGWTALICFERCYFKFFRRCMAVNTTRRSQPPRLLNEAARPSGRHVSKGLLGGSRRCAVDGDMSALAVWFKALTSFRVAGATRGRGRHRCLPVTAPLAYNK